MRNNFYCTCRNDAPNLQRVALQHCTTLRFEVSLHHAALGRNHLPLYSFKVIIEFKESLGVLLHAHRVILVYEILKS